MDYREKIMELIRKIDDADILERIYCLTVYLYIYKTE